MFKTEERQIRWKKTTKAVEEIKQERGINVFFWTFTGSQWSSDNRRVTWSLFNFSWNKSCSIILDFFESKKALTVLDAKTTLTDVWYSRLLRMRDERNWGMTHWLTQQKQRLELAVLQMQLMCWYRIPWRCRPRLLRESFNFMPTHCQKGFTSQSFKKNSNSVSRQSTPFSSSFLLYFGFLHIV